MEGEGFLPVDVKPLMVTAVSPVDETKGVGRGKNVKATFSEDVNPATVTTSTLELQISGTTTPIDAKVSYDSASRTAMLDPYGGSATLLKSCKWYTARVTTGIKDKAGNPLAEDKVWSFKTSGC